MQIDKDTIDDWINELFARVPTANIQEMCMNIALKATEVENKACAEICNQKAMRMEIDAQSADCDKEDSTSLRSSAWLISVCAKDIEARMRSDK